MPAPCEDDKLKRQKFSKYRAYEVRLPYASGGASMKKSDYKKCRPP